MMIFNYITPETRDKHRDEMSQYFACMAKVYGEISLDSYDTQSARYIVCHHNKYGVIGGLRLLPTLGPKLSDESLTNTGIALHDDQTWEITKLFLYLPDADSTDEASEEYNKICLEFYKGVWDYLKEVCDIQMLVTLLPEDEHEDASFFGGWPFVLESPVNNPFNAESDEYILGVLKLNEEEELSLAS